MKIEVRKRAAELLKKHYSTEEGNLDEIRKLVTDNIKIVFYGEYLDEVIEEALDDFKRVDNPPLHIMNLEAFHADRDPYLWLQENKHCKSVRYLFYKLRGQDFSLVVNNAFKTYIRGIYFLVYFFLSKFEEGEG